MELIQPIAIMKERKLGKNLLKNDYAEFQVFVLGDSGVAKFLKARRYSKEEIREDFYALYKQEKRRMALTKAANKKLEADGIADNGEAYALIDNFSARENEFSTLAFLNPDYIAPDGTVGKYAAMYKKKTLTKQEFLKVYDAYIEDSLQVFTEKLIKEGIVSRIQNKDGEIQLTSEQLNKEVREGASLEDVIADYYINTKFATIQQLQIFGQDTAFYENSKDLQKRYKEIHAPGEVLHVEAINPYTGEFWNGTRVITDPTTGERKIVANNIQRAVYFNDVSVNAETLDPNFMEAIFFQFAQTDTQNKEKGF